MNIEEKLKNFPNVYYVTLEESHERQKFMQDQFKKYGINGTPFYTKRLQDMDPRPKYIGDHADRIGFCLGVSISHINSLKHWYENTDDEVAIFCEDDHDFSTVEHWPFTWDEFVQSLPEGWECIQLIRIVSPLGEGFNVDLDLDIRYGRWWGSIGLMKRSWVKKILDRHLMEDGIYRMEVAWAEPFAENVLYWNIGTVYNFPLFTENTDIFSTTIVGNTKDYVFSKVAHRVSDIIVRDYWRLLGNSINIQSVMRNIK